MSHSKSMQTIEKMVERVLELARGVSWQAEIVKYPRSRSPKSIDIALHKKAFIKIVDSVLRLSSNEIQDLKKASYTLDISPIIVAERIGRHRLEEGVVYDKSGVPLISITTLAMFAKGDKVFIYSKKGSYYVKINAQMLRTLRERLGMSLGELAYKIGVSRKAVYEYERGNMDVTIETAERIYEVLGHESVFDSLDIFSMRPKLREEEEPSPHSTTENKLVKELRNIGLLTHHLRHTAADIVASKEDSRYIIVFTEEHQDKEPELKVRESIKLSKASQSKLIVLTEHTTNLEEIVESYGVSETSDIIIEKPDNLHRVIHEIRMYLRR